jgi:hypothetical protein
LEAWIKYKGSDKETYTRYGKTIPKIEMKIDVAGYFGCDREKEKFIASQLLSDSRIECRLQKSASDSVREMAEKIEAKALNKNKFISDVNKKFDGINKKVKENAEKIEMTDQAKEKLKETIEANNG